MWKPDESLDDYNVTPAEPVSSEPPRAVSLRLTGDVEILKPLTRSDDYAKPAAFKAFRGAAILQPLWFRRVLVVGSGALVLIAMALVSAILVGINDSTGPRDVATNEVQDEEPAQPQELFTFDLSTPSAFAPLTPVNIVRSNNRRRPSRPTLANRSKRELRSLAQPEQPKFMPTTLVIYAENGVINTRIEPWHQTSNTTPPAFNN